MTDSTIGPARQRYDADGFFLHREPLFPSDLVARAVEGMDAVRRGEYDTGREPQPSHWKPGEDLGKLCKIAQPQFASRAIRSLIRYPALGALAAELTGAFVDAYRHPESRPDGFFDPKGEKLVEAIRQVLQGKTYVSENMSGKVLEIFSHRRRRADDTTIGKLTDREFEVFRLLGQGMTTREIGQQLRLSTKTVETHRLHVREKLGLKSGPALIKYAVRWAGTQELI